MKSLQLRLCRAMFSALILSLAAVSVINLLLAHSDAVTAGQNNVTLRAQQGAEQINTWAQTIITSVDTVADSTATTLQYYIGDVTKLSPLYADITQAIGVYDTYFGLADGRAMFSDGWEPESDWISYERDWYKQAVANPGKVIITDPYVDSESNEVCYTFAKTMVGANNQIIGVLAVDALLGDVTAVLADAVAFDETAVCALTDQDGGILNHTDTTFNPDKDCNLQNVFNINDNQLADHKGESVFSAGKRTWAQVDVASTGWHVYLSLPDAVVMATFRMSLLLSILAGIICLAGSVAVLFVAIKNEVIRPVRMFEREARRLAVGETEIPPVPARSSELQNLSAAFQEIVSGIRTQKDVLESVADGNYTVTLQPRGEADVLNRAINTMTEQVRMTIAKLRTAINEFNDAAVNISGGAEALANGTISQSESTGRMRSQLTTFSASVMQNRDDAAQAADLSVETADAVVSTQAAMTQMGDSMQSIAENSVEIAKIMKIIDDIAFQTNILALNASVEAARAGEHGKGFAVVADEVRSLAERSAEASRSVAGTIESSNAKIHEGTDIAADAAREFDVIRTHVGTISDLLQNVRTASAASAEEINVFETALGEVVEIITRNTATGEENAAAATELSELSNEMREMVQAFVV